MVNMFSVRTITVEPSVFLYFMANTLSSNLATNLLLYKACVPNTADGEEWRPAPDEKCPDEAKAQHILSEINTWKYLVLYTVPAVVTFFAGPWSDRHGCRRRPLIFVAVFGQIGTDLLNAYCSWHWTLSPNVTAILQVSALLVTGSTTLMNMGVFAQVVDGTDVQNRTFRFGIVVFMLTVGSTAGQLIFGFIVPAIGFLKSFLVCASMSATALGLGIFLIPDLSTNYTKVGFWHDIAQTISPNIVAVCFKVANRKRKYNKKIVLLLTVMIAVPLTSSIFAGELSLMYMFVRKKFNWDESNFGVYIGCTEGVMMIGTTLIYGIMSKLFEINDSMIGFIATVFDLATAVSFLIASQSWHLYLIPPLQLFRGAALSITRSITSKCVEAHELGTSNSVRLVIECSLKAIITTMYNIVYDRTLETIPSAFFIISIVLAMPLLGCFATTYYLSRDQVKQTDCQPKSKNELKILITTEM
ncbi:uncharacterized protein LOC126834602 isoform X1 [Adelges cooleyi]|uniref:uncharacterized protein LOC126834602 isoform X1 n=1 Tax=Adelges cooleyi TaxID=133065 RepID=UPI0021808C81|nr:uncharacterized protein LOC126834602 isoform X1 [Adelges cooleyi]